MVCGKAAELLHIHLGHEFKLASIQDKFYRGFPGAHIHLLLQAREAGGTLKVEISKQDVLDRVAELLKKQDLSKYVL